MTERIRRFTTFLGPTTGRWLTICIGATLWWAYTGVGQWIGIALVLTAALIPLTNPAPTDTPETVESSPGGRRPGLRGVFRWMGQTIRPSALLHSRWLGPLVLTGVVVAQCWPWFLGEMSLRGDHPIHLFKAWVLWDRLLPDGEILGWSHDLHAGYPANMLYPPGVDLWICAYRALTLGLLDWMTTYAHAFALGVWFSTLAIYSLGVRVVGRGAAFIGTLVYTLDKGGFNEGGWSFSIVDGVWGQLLALAFGCLGLRSLVSLFNLHHEPTTPDPDSPAPFSATLRRTLSAAAFGAFATLCHPNGLLFVGITYTLAIGIGAVTQPPRFRSILTTGGIILTLVACCSAFFYVPLSGFGDYLFNLADTPQTTASVAERALDGTFFRQTLGLPVFLGLWGAFLALLSRSRGPLFLTAMLGIFVGLSMTHVVIDLRLLDIHPFFARLDYRRFLFMAKLPLFLLAGMALTIVWTRIRQRIGTHATHEGWRTALPVFLVVLCITPLVSPMVEALQDSGQPKVKFAKDEWDWSALQAFFEFSATLNDGEPYRIAYVDDHDLHTFGVAPPLNGHPMYKVGFMPVDTFSGRFSVWDSEAFRKLGVRYVVTRRKNDTNPTGLRLVKTFAAPKGPPVLVFELENFRFEPWETTNNTQVKLSQWSRESIELNVTGALPNTPVTLRVAHFPGWTASLDGEHMPLNPAVYDPRMPVRFLSTVVPHDGVLRFEWNKTPIQQSMGWLSALTWLAMGGLLLRPRGAHTRWMAHPKVVNVAEWAMTGAVLIIMVLVIVFYGFSPPGRIEGYDTRWSFLSHLGDAQVWLEDESTGEIEPCDRPSLGRWMCSSDPKRDWNYVGPHVGNIGGLRACIWAHPSERNRLRIQFPEVPLDSRIVGRHEILGAAKGADVTLVIDVGYQEVGTRIKSDVSEAFFEIDTTAYKSTNQDVTFTVTAPKSGARHYCFEAYVADLKPGR